MLRVGPGLSGQPLLLPSVAFRRAFVWYRNFKKGRSSMSSCTSPRTIKGIVFVDGTLTEPVIDFPKMRRAVGVPDGEDTLDYLASLADDVRAEREAALHVVEEEGMARMKLMPGALELARFLDDRSVPRALVTRNKRQAVDLFHERHFRLAPFLPALTREFLPYKPHPAALLHIAQHWAIDPAELVMIGDSAKDDVVSGRRAGAVTVLLDTERKYPERGGELPEEQRPDYYADSLEKVQEILETKLNLAGSVKAGAAR